MPPLNRHSCLKVVAAASILACVPSAMISAQSEKQLMVKRTTPAGPAARKSTAKDLRASLRQPEFLERYAATHRFANGRPTGIEITRAGDSVLFLRSGPQ